MGFTWFLLVVYSPRCELSRVSPHYKSMTTESIKKRPITSQPEAKVRPQESFSGKKSEAHPNYIKYGFAKSAQVFKVGMTQFDKLTNNQRVGAGVAAFFLLFWPLFGLLMFSPWLLTASIIAYSLLYGFPSFVADLEEAIITETNISEPVKLVSISLSLSFS